MIIISSLFQGHITYESFSYNQTILFERSIAFQLRHIWSRCIDLSLLKHFVYVTIYVSTTYFFLEFEVAAKEILWLLTGKYLAEGTEIFCSPQNISVALTVSFLPRCRTYIGPQEVRPSNAYTIIRCCSNCTVQNGICHQHGHTFDGLKTTLIRLASNHTKSSPSVRGSRIKKENLISPSVVLKSYLFFFNGNFSPICTNENIQGHYTLNNYVSCIGNGVMQKASNYPIVTTSSALYNTDFSERNIFENFSCLISDLNFPSGGDEFPVSQMTDTCSYTGKEQGAFQNVKEDGNVDMHMLEANENKQEEKVQSNSLVNLEELKSEKWDSSETRVPCKRDKTFLSPNTPPKKDIAIKNDLRDEFQTPSNNDYENENFTSVFTKSLTSLYSNDSETAYANDINMKCVVGDVGSRLEEGEFSSDSIESKNGTNKLRSDSISDQSFESAFHIVEKPSVESSLGLHSIQAENGNMFSSDSESGCDAKKVQADLNAKATALTCFRYEPFELPNAFAGKPEIESEFGLGPNNQDGTLLSIGENSDSFSQEKPIGFNMPTFQWKRSGFSSGLRQPSMRGRLESRNQVCSARKLLLVNQRKGHIVPNKNLRSVRGRRSRSIHDENSSKSLSEKPYMKISGLSVYATVQDGVVLSVKCKRYKRRSGKQYNKNGEKILSVLNSELNPSLENPCISNGSFNSDDHFDETDHEMKATTETTTVAALELSHEEHQSTIDIQNLSNEEIRKLVSKLCVDYSLDHRDFDDPEQIKAVSVIEDMDEAEVRRSRPRRPVTVQYGSESESSSVDTSRSSFKEGSDTKDAAGGHRILRSLPCRRSPRTLRNGIKSAFTHRYCTRNAENQLSADEYNTFSEFSESDKPVSVPEEPSISASSKEDCSDVILKEASLSSHQEFFHQGNGIKNENIPVVDPGIRTEPISCTLDNVTTGSAIKCENIHNIQQVCVEAKQNINEFSNNTDGMYLNGKQNKSMEPVPCQAVPPEDPYLREHALMEPPGLVKVENENSYFNMEKGNKSDSSNIHEDRLSPRYLVVESTLPQTDNISEQNSDHVRLSFDSANAWLSQEDNDNYFVADSDLDKVETKPVVQSILENHDKSGKDLASEVPVLLKTLKREPTSSPVGNEYMDKNQENFDDDCIVISVDDDDDNSPQSMKEPLKIFPKKELLEHHHTMENKIPTFASSEGMDLRLLKDLPSRGELSVSKSGFLHKDERDESILRNLLLDSTDNISNAPTSTPSSQDHSSPTPIITSVISLNGLKSISPSPPPQSQQDTLKRPSSVDSFSPFLSRSKYIKTMDMMPAHGHHDRENSHDISHTSLISPNSKEKCDLRRLLSSENVSPSYSPKPPAGDNRDQPWTKDPHQMKDNIKKLKNEIVYLQMMAEQKEKEKIAIVCFKRYKEEILKRMYKAYAYSLRNRLNEFLRPEDCPNDARGRVSQSMLHSVPPNSLAQPPSKFNEPVPSAPQGSVQHPNQCANTNFQDPTIKLSPRHQRFTAPYDYSNGGAQRANYKLQISALESRSIPSYNDKPPTVESMMTNTSDNYGFDMRSVKECSDDRKARLKASLANSILQKALASRDAFAASVSESIPSSCSSVRSYQFNKSCNYAASHINVSNSTSAPVPIPKRYPCETTPIDMAMSRGSLSRPPAKKISSEASSPYNGIFDSSHPSLQVNTRNSKEGCSMQTILKECRGRSGNMIPSTMWSMPNGDNVNQSQMHDNRKGDVKLEPTIAQRRQQVESVPSTLRHDSFMMSRAHVENNTLSASSVASSKAPVPVPHQRVMASNKDGATLNGVLDRLYSRKLEEGRMKGYVTSSSANSTAPYGGRMIKTEITPKNAPNTGSGVISNNCSGGTLNSPRCMGCGLSDAKFLCSGCRKDWYCSPQCQSLRWPEHSQACAGRIYGQAPGSFS